MIILKPKYTSFLRVIDCGDGYICLEKTGTNFPTGTSNLYKLDKPGNLVWSAEFVNEWMLYTNVVIRDRKLFALNTAGEADLDPTTGELSNWVFTK